eukprot:1318670-Amorphochlora_amoeboformis.AAC.1
MFRNRKDNAKSPCRIPCPGGGQVGDSPRMGGFGNGRGVRPTIFQTPPPLAHRYCLRAFLSKANNAMLIECIGRYDTPIPPTICRRKGEPGDANTAAASRTEAANACCRHHFEKGVVNGCQGDEHGECEGLAIEKAW